MWHSLFAYVLIVDWPSVMHCILFRAIVRTGWLMHLLANKIKYERRNHFRRLSRGPQGKLNTANMTKACSWPSNPFPFVHAQGCQQLCSSSLGPQSTSIPHPFSTPSSFPYRSDTLGLVVVFTLFLPFSLFDSARVIVVFSMGLFAFCP